MATENKAPPPPKPAGEVPLPDDISSLADDEGPLACAALHLRMTTLGCLDVDDGSLADGLRDARRELKFYGNAREAAGRAGADRLHGIEDSCRKVYAAIPPLPVTQETADAATDALHAFCFMLGAHQIDVDLKPYTPPQHLAAANQQMTTQGEGSIALQIAGWIHEDELPEGYPYAAMFTYSKVDGVRLFPVYAPAKGAGREAVAWMVRNRETKEIWWDECCVWLTEKDAADCAEDMNANIEDANFEAFALYTRPSPVADAEAQS